MADFLDCDLKGLGLEALLALLIESDGSGGAQLKTSGASGVAGGLSVYTNINNSDFIATANAGTKTATITGLGFTLEDDNVAVGAAYKETGGVYTTIPVNDVTVAAGVVTFTNLSDNFAVGDEVVMLIIGKTKAYDIDQDLLKTSDQTPDYGHYTDPEHIIDETDLAEGGGGDGDGGAGDNYYYLIPMASYHHFSVIFLSTTGAGNTFTIDLYGTNNPDAVSSPDDDVDLDDDAWIDMSGFLADVGQLTVAAGQTKQRDGWFVGEEDLPIKYLLIQVTVVDGGTEDNSLDAWVVKSY